MTANKPKANDPDRSAVPMAQQLLHGEEAALPAVLRDYGPAVGAAIKRKYFILNNHDVEDILSTALAQLWRFRDRFDPAKGSLRASFFRIADHVAQDLLRHGWHKAREREVSLHDIHPAKVAGPAATQTPDSQPESPEVERPPNEQHLRQIVDSLPEAYRYIILADACARDRVASTSLLAQELDIPEGSVRVYRSRAMASIRMELRRLGYSLP